MKYIRTTVTQIVHQTPALPARVRELRNQYQAAGATYTDALALALLEVLTSDKPAKRRARKS